MVKQTSIASRRPRAASGTVSRRLVFVTQKADPVDPVLGATVPKIRALAARVDELIVLAASSVPGSLPENCRVLHFGAGTKALRGVRYETSLVRSLRPRPFALVAHMCPIYAVLAAPVLRPLRIPIVLWYVRVATKVATRIASVDGTSFPIDTPKLAAIGHGIDVHALTCVPSRRNGPLRLLALGRYSRVKRLEVVLDAMARVRSPVTLEAYGPEGHAGYREELTAKASELGVEARFAGPVAFADVPGLYAEHDVLVSNTRGGADKVVLEAAASCRPALASSPSLATVVDDLAYDGADELAARLDRLAGLSAEDLGRLGRSLRERVERSHSVDSWADAIIRLAER
jgi:glycosyltransferase involved in cell wall biosynthesis